MERSAPYLRLAVATLAAAMAVLFVAGYCGLALIVVPARVHLHLKPDDLMRWLPGCTHYVVHYRWYASFVPVFFCSFGLFALRRWGNKAAFEVAVGCQWLFVVLWPALCLLAWMLPEIPFVDVIH